MIPGLNPLFYTARTVGNFSVIASPGSVGGAGTAGPVNTGQATALPQGGTAPFTYSWLKYSGDPSITAASPAASTTDFVATLGPSDATSATFYCKVTDATAAVGTSNLVTALLRTTGS